MALACLRRPPGPGKRREAESTEGSVPVLRCVQNVLSLSVPVPEPTPIGAESLLGKKEFEHNLHAEKELVRKLQGNPKNLDLVSQYVKENKGKIISFEEQQGFQLRVCDLDETFYEGQLDMLEYWEALYLPEPTKMVVLGTVDDVPCLATGQQLVILVAADGSVYAYEEELLHRVGKTLPEFLKKGLQLFGQEVYPCAGDLEPESEEEWAKDPEIQQIKQRTSDFIQSKVEAFGKHLDFLSSLR